MNFENNSAGNNETNQAADWDMSDAPSFEGAQNGLGEEAPEKPLSFAEIIKSIDSTNVDIPDTLNSTNPDAKTEFMENPELQVPNNTHDNLQRDEVSARLEKLQSIAEEIESNPELSEKEKRVARVALDSCLTKNQFLLAIANYNDNPSEENAEAYREVNERLYGKPDEAVFYSLLKEKIDKIEKRELSPEEEQEYAELKELLGPLPQGGAERFKPQEKTIKAMQEKVNAYMEPIFRYVPEDKETFSAEETADIVQAAFDDFLPEGSEWRVVVEPNRASIAANEIERTLKLAGNRVKGDPTPLVMKQILAHEVGTHMLRAQNFENSPIEMFRVGLPGNSDFDEGIAKVMEQSVAGKYEDSGINHYLSIGMANILNTDFRTTYEIQKRLAHLSSGKNQDDLMFTSVQRAFRGTDKLPNNKDLVYYNGAENVWKYVEQNLDDPDLFDNLFLNGKIDVRNPEHESLAYELKVGGFGPEAAE